MPAFAFALALTAAFVHALWNVLLARARDPQAATAVALLVAVVVFAPVAALTWDVRPGVWPFLVASSCLQLLYFVLLAAAYRRAPLSVVYPMARGAAPVLVLLIGVIALGKSSSWGQATGVRARRRRDPARARRPPGGRGRGDVRPRDRDLHRRLHARRQARDHARGADLRTWS